MPRPSSDVAFTETVKAIQQARGSRGAYARKEEKGGFHTQVTADLSAFIAERSSFYLATANRDGQPYVQHRGGPPGFLRVIDSTTLGFADYAGNRQYITTGNLAVNPRAFLFLMDYANQRRIKIWGTARVESDADVIGRLFPAGYQARPEQAILFSVEAWDANCPQHIPQLLAAEDVAATIAWFQARMREMEAEKATLLSRIAALERAQPGG